MNKPHVTTLRDRIRNAIRAFKGQPIGSLTFGVDVKKCSECDYKNRLERILYICDGKACEDGCHADFCNHTTDVRHAVNFELVEHPDRKYYIEKADKECVGKEESE